MLENIGDTDIFIAGTFDSFAYREILNRLLNINNLSKCKMIIPYISKNGIASRTFTNKIIIKGGEVRLNSRFNNNLIIIDNNAFVLSFNQKYNPGYGMKSSFESCILTNADKVINDVKEIFMNNWHNSLPLNNA
jgi:hypothetical protein